MTTARSAAVEVIPLGGLGEIGLNMTLFALPVMLVSPFAGTFAARRGSLRVTVIAIGVTLPIVASYGFLDSVLVLTCVMMV